MLVESVRDGESKRKFICVIAIPTKKKRTGIKTSLKSTYFHLRYSNLTLLNIIALMLENKLKELF